MGTLIISLFVITTIVIAIYAVPLFSIYILVTGAIPFNPLVNARSLLTVFMGMGPSAVWMFSAIVGAQLVLLVRAKYCLAIVRYNYFHLLFIIYCSFTLFWAPSIIYGVRMLAKLITPFLLYLIFSDSFIKMSSNKFYKIMISIMLTLLVFALSNYFIGYYRISIFSGVKSLAVPGSGSSLFSFAMSCAALLVFANYLVNRKKHNIILYAFFIIAIIMAFVRISFFGIIFASLMCHFLISKNKLLSFTIIILTIIIVIITTFENDYLRTRMFMHPEHLNIGDLFFDPKSIIADIHTSGRLSTWKVALDIFFLPNQLTGSGVGATQLWFYRASEHSVGVMHSEYLRLLCETGIIGLVLFIIAMLQYIKNQLFILKKTTNPNDKIYSILAISSMLFYLITMLTDNSLDYLSLFGIYIFAYNAFAMKYYRTNCGKIFR